MNLPIGVSRFMECGGMTPLFRRAPVISASLSELSASALSFLFFSHSLALGFLLFSIHSFL